MKKTIDIIGTIETPFGEKFGVPRQSGMINRITSTITLLPKYSTPDAFRGLEGFSYIWVIWGFSENKEQKWSPTVRPPRLGGNTKKGVFATRSPNRPNPLGLSSLKLHKIEYIDKKMKLTVSGADMVNGTPIYDIKPYIAFTDSHPDATLGFAESYKDYSLDVVMDAYPSIDSDKLQNIKEILSLDPRPSYQDDKDRIYGVNLYGYNVKFKVDGTTIYVISIE